MLKLSDFENFKDFFNIFELLFGFFVFGINL